MEALLAGFVAGHAMGLFSLALLAWRVTALAGPLRGWQGRLPEGLALPALTMGLALAGQLLWGLLGLLFGGVYWAVRSEAANGLGSPAWGYTLAVLLLAGLSAAAAVTLQPQWWRRAALLALAFAGVFGWLIPHLAEA